MVKIVKIAGESLVPLYDDGDFALVCRIPIFFNRLKCGDIVVFKNSIHGIMIKRVDKYDHKKGELWVSGIHPESIDSSELGSVKLGDLVGKVVFHISKPR